MRYTFGWWLLNWLRPIQVRPRRRGGGVARDWRWRR